MEMNLKKSTISFDNLNENVEQVIITLLQFRHVELKEGLKHLGFILKPLGYGIKDCSWLAGKIECRIHLWCH